MKNRLGALRDRFSEPIGDYVAGFTDGLLPFQRSQKTTTASYRLGFNHGRAIGQLLYQAARNGFGMGFS